MPEQVLRGVGDGLEQRERDVLADDGRGLEQGLLFRKEAVDPSGEDGLHRGRHLDGLEGPRQSIAAPLAGQRAGLHERPHTLLEEEGDSLRSLD